MAEITAGMVKSLRDKTDAPMMECKKALSEAGGDLDKAEEILRVKLGNKASKAAGRIAAEGMVAAYVAGDAKLGALIEVNCETDFVAKNADFIAFAQALAQLVAERNPADVTALSALPLGVNTVADARTALVGKLGENVALRRFVRVEAKGKIARYLHGAKIGVLVDYSGGDEQLGKDLAMHIAATKPLCIAKDEVPAEVVARERDIQAARAKESGKPDHIVVKMLDGAVNKYLAEVTLLGQTFVKNDKQSIEQLLKSQGATVHAFHLFVVGEGIEKKKDDFAAEVRAQAEQARQGQDQATR